MKIKYRAVSYPPLIEKVEIEKESNNSVWIRGRPRRKITDYDAYFDTFDEAKNHLIQKAQKEIDDADRNLAYAQTKLQRTQSIKEPK